MVNVDFVTYSGSPPPGCPTDIWADLCETGLPKNVIDMFVASPEPELASARVAGEQTSGLVFGHTRDGDGLYLDFVRGRVWMLWVEDSGHTVVNNSVRAFRESLLLVESRYPFDPGDGTLRSAWEAEHALRQALLEIDKDALVDPNGFWSTFLEDVAVGDHSG